MTFRGEIDILMHCMSPSTNRLAVSATCYVHLITYYLLVQTEICTAWNYVHHRNVYHWIEWTINTKEQFTVQYISTKCSVKASVESLLVEKSHGKWQQNNLEKLSVIQSYQWTWNYFFLSFQHVSKTKFFFRSQHSPSTTDWNEWWTAEQSAHTVAHSTFS